MGTASNGLKDHHKSATINPWTGLLSNVGRVITEFVVVVVVVVVRK
jgi:hypothetical protein